MTALSEEQFDELLNEEYFIKSESEEEFTFYFKARLKEDPELKIDSIAKRGLKSFTYKKGNGTCIVYLWDKDLIKLKLTETVEELAIINKFNVNYDFQTAIPYAQDLFSFRYETDERRELVRKDFEVLSELKLNYLLASMKTLVPMEGHALQLPNGEFVYICSVSKTKAQTTPGGSFGLFGEITYSGGLDSGVLLEDIYKTSEDYLLPVWFCHEGRLGPHRGINAVIRTTVWKCKRTADISKVKTKRNY